LVDHELKDYLNHNEMNSLFSVTINKDNSRTDSYKSTFHVSAKSPKDSLYKETEEFLTTKN